MPDLGDQIVAGYQNSQFPVGLGERQFLPDGRLDRLITRASVVTAIGLPNNWDRVSVEDKKLVNFVVESAKKVFAITITTSMGRDGPELRKAMLTFKTHGFGDASLPVKPESWTSESPLVRDLRWKKAELNWFMHHQWTYLAPIFPKTVWEADLEPDRILPFTFVDNTSRAGSFGSVYQVTIHPAHQETPLLKANGEPANVAIKEVSTTTGEQDTLGRGHGHHWQAEAEAEALKQISSLKHPHLIEVKAIIRKGGKYYFMFPWADGGNLRDYFKENRQPKLNSRFVREIFKQLSRLADAIHAMHEFSIRHGDLKPENIVRFVDETEVGILKIADLALARHHEEETSVRLAQTETNEGTLLYEPPEVYTMADAPRSRRYDIWAMGCIYLELLIWLLYGYDGLLAFYDDLYDPLRRGKQFWDINLNKEQAELHPKVVAYIRHMARDPECAGSSAMRDLLDLVRTQLLVVRLPSRGADPVNLGEFAGDRSPSLKSLLRPIRADSRQLRSAFADILAKGERDENYWFTGQPRDGLLGPMSSRRASRRLGFQEGLAMPNVPG
ncbi:kinase-like domain-containing protein [Xylaria arbuscula]|nr:kinase-like domain-containing protein [Xylaria arbuscula]